MSNPMLDDRRRLRCFVVPNARILDIFRGEARVSLADLPADAELYSVWFNQMRLSWVVIVRSRSFAPVPDGAEIPCDETIIEVISTSARDASASPPADPSWRDRPPLV